MSAYKYSHMPIRFLIPRLRIREAKLMSHIFPLITLASEYKDTHQAKKILRFYFLSTNTSSTYL